MTVADFGSQAIICKALKEAFSDIPIVGEEDATALRQDDQEATVNKITGYVQEIIETATASNVLDWIDDGNGQVGKRFWTLDPIDGTKGFLRQDQYAIALALIEDGEVKLGILGCPALSFQEGETGYIFVAVRGEGSYRMPISGGEMTKLQVVSSDDVSRFRFVESVEASHGNQEQQNAIAQAVGITSESVPSPKYPDYRENIWDHAAGAIVVEEAGGTVTDMYGKSLDFGSASKMHDNRGVVVSNGTIHDAVLKALN